MINKLILPSSINSSCLPKFSPNSCTFSNAGTIRYCINHGLHWPNLSWPFLKDFVPINMDFKTGLDITVREQEVQDFAPIYTVSKEGNSYNIIWVKVENASSPTWMDFKRGSSYLMKLPYYLPINSREGHCWNEYIPEVIVSTVVFLMITEALNNEWSFTVIALRESRSTWIMNQKKTQ